MTHGIRLKSPRISRIKHPKERVVYDTKNINKTMIVCKILWFSLFISSFAIGDVRINLDQELVERDRHSELREETIKHFGKLDKYQYLVMCSDSNPMYSVGVRRIDAKSIELLYWEQEMKVVYRRKMDNGFILKLEEAFSKLTKKALAQSGRKSDEVTTSNYVVYVFKKSGNRDDPFTRWTSVKFEKNSDSSGDSLLKLVLPHRWPWVRNVDDAVEDGKKVRPSGTEPHAPTPHAPVHSEGRVDPPKK